MSIQHNLPTEKPYEKFFGRTKAIQTIEATLLDGGTFIASIDGVGGIGKTALAHHFCLEKIVQADNPRFDHLVWISSKETVFDPFKNQTRSIEASFQGLETLFDSLLCVCDFEDYIEESHERKREFCAEILQETSVLFVLDNLENVRDDDFFSYIKEDFNRFSGQNRNLKVLTTSRKRGQIADFPIEIGGLELEDALAMLKYGADTYEIRDIKNATDHDNMILLEKVCKIPLGIKFIIEQMRRGKTRGAIYQELSGYPDLNNDNMDDNEKKAKMSEIIQFSFKDMYETLDETHQHVFVTVAILQKSRKKNDPDISLELLVNITGFGSRELEGVLENLIENNLLERCIGNTYQVSQMAINFATQNYEIFEDIEDDVVGKFIELVDPGQQSDTGIDGVEYFLKNAQVSLNQNQYDEAKKCLMNGIGIYPNDDRLHYELGKIQESLNEFRKATDSFGDATKCDPKNVRVWDNWIRMEDRRQRYNMAIRIADDALTHTDHDVTILIQKLNILKFLHLKSSSGNHLRTLRTEATDAENEYNRQNRSSDVLRLLHGWEKVEYAFVKGQFVNQFDGYISVIDKLIKKETANQTLIDILQKAERVLHNNGYRGGALKRFNRKANSIANSLISMSTLVKNMEENFDSRHYNHAEQEAQRILGLLASKKKRGDHYARKALYVLLQIYNNREDYDRVISQYQLYKNFGRQDRECKRLHNIAQSKKSDQEKRNMVNEIKQKLEESECEIRRVVMWSLENDEKTLLAVLEKNNGVNWINKWSNYRTQSPSDDNLLDYSSFTELREVLKWCKNKITMKTQNNKRSEVGRCCRNIINSLEKFSIIEFHNIIQERDEASHHRLLNRSKEDLNLILISLGLLLGNVSNLKEAINLD